MLSEGHIINGSTYYDPFSPQARETFYNFSKTAHFSIGVDALWLDATEPEGLPNHDALLSLGTGDELLNAYSLMTTKAIADGLRRDYPGAQGRRVFSLTRSSFAGQQRTGATLWSGDTTSTWDVLRRQVTAALNYQLSGIPYWSEDIGGFFRPSDQYSSASYQDLLVRWFQYGVFTPIFRVHGGGSNTELWNYGAETQALIVDSAIHFRYRLLPYIYSGFHRVEAEGWTMQRGLALDFTGDAVALGITDQFMWGPSLLVAPLVSPLDPGRGCSPRSAYLPAVSSPGWTDFYSGETLSSSQGSARDLCVPLNETALFVRPGSILPLGPFLQYTGEKPADPLEIRVYRGPATTFELYEDDGESPSPVRTALVTTPSVSRGGGGRGTRVLTLGTAMAVSFLFFPTPPGSQG